MIQPGDLVLAIDPAKVQRAEKVAHKQLVRNGKMNLSLVCTLMEGKIIPFAMTQMKKENVFQESKKRII